MICQGLTAVFKSVLGSISPELPYMLLILAYLSFYLLGLYSSSKPRISFFFSVGLTTLIVGVIIFTLTGGNLFLGAIVALSHILIASIIRKTSYN